MKKIVFTLLLLLLSICSSNAQIVSKINSGDIYTIKGYELPKTNDLLLRVQYPKLKKVYATSRLYEVKIWSNCVHVVYEIEAVEDLKHGLWLGFANNGYLSTPDGNIKLMVNSVVEGDQLYRTGYENIRYYGKLKKGEKCYFTLNFAGTLPPGVNEIEIHSGSQYYCHSSANYVVQTEGYYSTKYCCFSIQNLNNPRKYYYENLTSESSIKQNINSNNDGICGIYESIGSSTKVKLACVKIDGEYRLIHLHRNPSLNWWQVGDIKAWLTKTPSGIFKTTWMNMDKSQDDDYYTAFDGYSMIVNKGGSKSETKFLKTYPTESPASGSQVGGSNGSGSKEWTGTGFALKNGYIVTNNHVVDGAKSIVVLGVNGNTYTEYSARVVSVDKNNDLALIKINDGRFNGFNNIPYAVLNATRDVGSDVFVLGYPLTDYMGDEIKLTNGIISSKTGYQGDVSTYQISAPVQPGNSGGPLFDNSGNVIGVVNSGIPGAENVGYAIKTSYLYNLVESAANTNIIPQNNSVTGSSLSEKVKQVKNCVFFIKCKGN